MKFLSYNQTNKYSHNKPQDEKEGQTIAGFFGRCVQRPAAMEAANEYILNWLHKKEA